MPVALTDVVLLWLFARMIREKQIVPAAKIFRGLFP